MKIKEVVEYANKYVHPDVEKVLNKYERKAKGKKRVMGYHPSILAYPYRVK